MQYNHTFSISKNGKTFIWNVERLWELSKNLPIVEAPISEFNGYLDRDCWFGGNGVTTRMVAMHCKRIEKSDLTYPIILNADGGVMDGTHRLAKALIMGLATIKTVRFTSTPEPDLVQENA